MDTDILFLIIDLQLKVIENTLEKFDPNCKRVYQEELTSLSSEFVKAHPEAREILEKLKEKHGVK